MGTVLACVTLSPINLCRTVHFITFSYCKQTELVPVWGRQHRAEPHLRTCASLHPIQVTLWFLRRSQERPLTGRKTVKLRQSAGDAQVDHVFRADSVQEEAEGRQLRNQCEETQENVGNAKQNDKQRSQCYNTRLMDPRTHNKAKWQSAIKKNAPNTFIT